MPFPDHFVEDCSQRRRFAGAGWSSDQHDAITQLNYFLEFRRQAQIRETGNIVRNYTNHDRARSALPEYICGEPPHAVYSIRQVRTKYLRSGFRSIIDKSSHVSFQFGQVFVTDIHHVTRFVIL